VALQDQVAYYLILYLFHCTAVPPGDHLGKQWRY